MRLNRDHYETFERMHYVCFHDEFEHDLPDANPDVDEDCGVPGCPSAPAMRRREQRAETARELQTDWSDGPPRY